MEPFIGEIRAFGFNYAPQGWEPCNGQLVKISENQALYALLGTAFGGNGTTTFGLPDLRGRNAISQGRGAGLSDRHIGYNGGVETVVLTPTQMPAHNHDLNSTNAKAALKCSSAEATTTTPVGGTISKNVSRVDMLRFNTASPDSAMKDGAVVLSGATENSGTGQAQENMAPYLVVNYCIATQGIFPPRH